MRVLNCVQLRQPLVQPKDVVGHDTLIACSATIIVFQDIKPVEKRFALPSPFNRVHATSLSCSKPIAWKQLKLRQPDTRFNASHPCIVVPGSPTGGGTNTKRRVWTLVNVQEADVSRKHIDCREFPSESKCTIAISADSED